MTNPVEMDETYVSDGKGEEKLVKPGDKVILLSPQEMQQKRDDKDEYFAQKHFDFLLNWLGEGPFTISWIGKWPCGRIMLYLKGAKSDEPGAYASDFMKAY